MYLFTFVFHYESLSFPKSIYPEQVPIVTDTKIYIEFHTMHPQQNVMYLQRVMTGNAGNNIETPLNIPEKKSNFPKEISGIIAN